MMTLKKSVNVLFLLIILILLPGMAGRVMAQMDWSVPDRLPPSSGSYRLTTDVTTDTWSLNGGKRELDLNGHTVIFNDYGVASIDGQATMQIRDQKGGGSIRFTGSGERAHLKICNGTLIFESGIIAGNIELNPGHLFLDAEAKVQMSGGEIRGSVIFSKPSESFSQESPAEMNMTGGTITCSNSRCVSMNYEKAVFNLKNGAIRADGVFQTIGILSGTFRQSGGEIKLLQNHLTGSNGVVLGNDVTTADSGSFIMEGGSITGFTGVSGYDIGYAVHLRNGGSVTMTGGEISGNRTAVRFDKGGSVTVTGGSITANNTGVFCRQNSTLKLSGSPKITGNSSENVFMNAEIQKINIMDGGLNSDARVGITSKKIASVEKISGVITAGLNGNYIPGVFFSDVSGYSVGMNKNGEMIFGQNNTVRFYVDGTKKSEQYLPDGSLIREFPQVPVDEGKILDGWYRKNDFTDKFDTENDIGDLPTNSLNLYARIIDETASIGETIYATLQEALSAANYGDTVKLLRDVTINAPLSLDKNVTLDLNGKTIDRGLTAPVEDGYVIRVTLGRRLTIKDSKGGGKITGGNNSGNGGAILVDDRGSLILEGGSISGNSAANGGGVYIAENASSGAFVARGGVINGNTGGNLYLSSGKTIAIHQALPNSTDIGVTLADGEGIFAESTGNYNGGILRASDVKGFVPDNTAYAVGVDTAGKGILGASVTISFDAGGQTVEPASAEVPAGGLVPKPTVTLPQGKSIAGWYRESTFQTKWNFNSSTADAALTLYAKITDSEPEAAIGSRTYDSVQDALDDAVSGDTVLLLRNVETETALTVVSGRTITLDLQIFTIDRGLSGTAARNDGAVIIVDGGNLTLTGDGTLTGGSGTTGGGVYVRNFGSFTLKNGIISGNNGSGVYVYRGDFTMDGGTISGNTRSYGGGVSVSGNMSSAPGIFTMKGGSIENNSADYGGAVSIGSSGMFIMEGGSIKNNSADYGGAFYVSDVQGTQQTAFTLRNGTISGNSAGENGGGLFIDYQGILRIEGGTLTGNTNGSEPDNIYLSAAYLDRNDYQGQKNRLIIADSPASGTQVGVTLENGTGNFAKAASGSAISFDPADVFNSDKSAYGVGLSGTGEAILGVPVTVDFSIAPAGLADAPAAQDLISGETVTEPAVTVPADYFFDGWYTDDTCGTKWNFDTDTVNGNITLYAKLLTVWQWVQSELDAENENITLPGDAIAGPNDGPLTTKSGSGVIIDLNGHTIDRGLTEKEAVVNGNVITANGDLYLIGSGTITGGNNNRDGGGILMSSGSRDLTINPGVTISGNKAAFRGGGIFFKADDGQLTFDGIVENNTAEKGGGIYAEGITFTTNNNTSPAIIRNNSAVAGGGIYIWFPENSYSHFELYNKQKLIITENSATGFGGGIYIDSYYGFKNDLCLTEITKNYAARSGGGIYIENANNLTIKYATVSANTAEEGGGGVYINRANNSNIIIGENTVIDSNFARSGSGGGIYANDYNSFVIQGNVQVSGNNTAGGANNVYLTNNKMISIREMDEDTLIGISMETPDVFTSGLSGKGDNTNFFSDDPAYAVGLNSVSEAYLGLAYTVSFNTGTSGISAPDAIKAAFASAISEPTLTSEDWFFLEGWYTEDTFRNKWNFSTDTVSGDMTLYAKFLTVWQWVQAQLDAVPVNEKITIKLPGDAAAGPNDGPLTTKSGAAWVTLDLNGHSINRGLSGSAAVFNGNVITANGNLSIINTGSGGGIITGGNNTGNGGGIVMNMDFDEFLILNNVTVKENHARDGGGIYSAAQNSILRLTENVVIESNHAVDGGGIYLSDSQIVTGSEVSISGNEADGNGGGLYYTITQAGAANEFKGTISNNKAGIGGGFYIKNGIRFDFSNAVISGNTASGDGGGGYIESVENFNAYKTNITGNTAAVDGGGLYIKEIRYDNSFLMTGGTVSGNTASGKGGGIFGPEYRGTFSIQGDVQVSGNTTGTDASNIYLTNGKKLNIVGALSGTEAIGISMKEPGVFTSGLSTRGSGSNFFSDDPAYAVGLNAHGEAYLGTARTVTFVLDKSGTSADDPVPAEMKLPDGSCLTEPTVGNVPDGYGVDGWYTDETYQSKWNFTHNTVSGDMTLYGRIMEAEASLKDGSGTTLYPTVQDAINAVRYGMNIGEITLLKDITPENSIFIENKNVVFDLAGHTITGTGDNLDYAVINVQNAFFTLIDSSSGQTGKIIGGADSTYGIYVEGFGSTTARLTIEGGTIEDCIGTQAGGGVYLAGNSGFILSGGRIIRNAAEENGSGIYFDAAGTQSFELKGGDGEISGNINDSGRTSNVWLPSKLVIDVKAPLIGKAGTIGITMEGITGVFARAASTYNGGKLTEADAAVFFSDDPDYTVRLNGNGEAELVRAYTVSFDTAGVGTAPEEQKVVSGEKVTAPSYTVPEGYVLTGWYKESTYNTLWNFDTDTVTGDITLYAGLEEAVAAIGETGYLTVQDAVNAAQAGETVKLLKSVTISAPVEIATGKTLTLDLAGKTIDRGLGSTEHGADNGNVITVNGNLTLADSLGEGRITGGFDSSYIGKSAGGVIVNSKAVFTLNGGEIYGNKSLNGSGGIYADYASIVINGGKIRGNNVFSVNGDGRGAGISLDNRSTLEMNGGEISMNNAHYGAGVYLDNSYFTMNNGFVIDNHAFCQGGGVYLTDRDSSFIMYDGKINGNDAEGTTGVPKGGGVYVNSGSFTLFDGTISENKARYIGMASGDGGGVYIAESGTLYIVGGKIQDNSASVNGGGVYYAGNIFSVRGGTISGNKNASGSSNVYLASGKKLDIRQRPADGSSVGITMADGSGTFAAGSGHTLSAEDKAYFFSDDPQYVVGLNGVGRLFLGKNCTVNFNANAAEGVTGTMDPQTFIEGEEQALSANAFHRTGYGFTGWNTAADGTGKSYDNGKKIIVSGDLTLYAQWDENVHTVTFIPNDSEGSIRAEGRMNAEIIDYGTTKNLTANAFTRKGYEFKGWNTVAAPTTENPGMPYNDGAEVTIEDDLTLYAQWELITYTITCDLKGGTLPEGQSNPTGYTVETDDISLLDPVRTGYTFSGWNDGSTTVQSVSIVKNSTGNRGYTAVWSANSYTVRYEPNGGSGTTQTEGFTYDREQYLAGWSPSGDPFDCTGYAFSGWNTRADGMGTNYGTREPVKNLTAEANATVTLYAQWNPVDYTITLPDMGGTGCSITAKINNEEVTAARYGDTVTLSVSLEEGFKLYANTLRVLYNDGSNRSVLFTPEQSQDVVSNTGYSFTQPAGNVTVEAFFLKAPEGKTGLYAGAAAQELVTAGASNFGPMQYALGNENSPTESYTTQIPAAKAAGTYYVWYRASENTAQQKIEVIITPTRVVIFYPNGGEGNMQPQTFIQGVKQELIPNNFTNGNNGFAGWNTSWDGMGTSYYNMQSIVVTKDLTLFAQWWKNHTVTFIGSGADRGAMQAQIFLPGTTQNLTANAFTREHYSFTGWKDADGNDYSDGQSITPGSDLTLYAQWKPETYTVFFNNNGGDGTMTQQAFTYGVSQELKKNEFNREGFHFTGWKDADGNDYSDGQPITIGGNLTLYAQWAVNKYTVTWKNYDGAELRTDQVPHGTVPDYSGETPVKELNDGYTYSFIGWGPVPAALNGNAEYTAQFDNGTLKNYTVSWKNYDGTVLKTEQVPHGTVPDYSDETPVKELNDGYTYRFTGWNPSPEALSGNAEYTAQFDNGTLKNYTVRWKNYDGTALKTEQIPHGTVPDYSGDTPVKELNDGYTYSFTCWDPVPAALNGDAEYTAVFSGTPIPAVNEPVFADAGGKYTGPITVRIYCGTDGADIYYTTDGSEPTENSIRYDAAAGIPVTVTTTVKAIAVKNGMRKSAVVSGTYIIEDRVPMDLTAEVTNITHTGAKGIPSDIGPQTLTLTILIKDGENVVSRADGVKLHVSGGMVKIQENAHFSSTVDFTKGHYSFAIVITPHTVFGIPPVEQRYILSANAWLNNHGNVTIYLTWDDGRRSEPEIIRIYALPEDEIGAYRLHDDGTKEYLIFHTYDLCMHWLGSDALCRGHERCFHKEDPYANPFAKGGLIEEIRR